MSANQNFVKDPTLIKKDRMRFTKNTLSSTLCYGAILFNVFYFVNIYSTNLAYYYTAMIGASVVYNLLFLLFTFLCSEGVKNYSKGYSITVLSIGCLQIARIFGIPFMAHNSTMMDTASKTDIPVMDDGQFYLVIAFLLVSAACAIAAGVIGIVKTTTLENYKKTIDAN